MSSTAQVPLLDEKSGQAGLVDADKAPAAFASGLKPAVKMVGPDGAAGWVTQDKLDQFRQNNYAIAPDHPGAQKMVTPDGRITYALPDEVQKFEGSGHTKILPNGNFQIKPMPGEDGGDVMKRAVNVGRALGPQEMERGRQAEQEW